MRTFLRNKLNCFSTKVKKSPLFIDLCREYWKIEKEPSRNNKEAIFLQFFSSFAKQPDLVEKIIRLTVPSNQEKNTGEEIRLQYKYDSIVQKFIEDHMGIPKDVIIENKGDLPNLIMKNFKKRRDVLDYSLTVGHVYDYKEKMKVAIGNDSQTEKIEIIKELFEKCYEKLEAYYLTRIFLNRMKLGFGQKSIIKSLSLIRSSLDLKEYNSLCVVLQGIFQRNISLQDDGISPGLFILI